MQRIHGSNEDPGFAKFYLATKAMVCSRTSGAISRRYFLAGTATALSVPFLGACLSEPPTGTGSPPGSARLTARPGLPTESPTLGLSELGIGGGRDGVMYVPQGYSSDTPAPLFIGLHGAGGDADDWASYPDRAEQRGMIFVAPDSRGSTWDLVDLASRGFGPDVEFIDDMLSYVFERCRIDPSRIALGGFSDGATYALSLGVGNGDLFSHIVSYSPGLWAIPDPVVGTPDIFVSHGQDDLVLPFSNTANAIVPALRDRGYDVTFHEFEGGHEVPGDVSETALDWFLG